MVMYSYVTSVELCGWNLARLNKNLDLLELFQICSVAKTVICPPVGKRESAKSSANVCVIFFPALRELAINSAGIVPPCTV